MILGFWIALWLIVLMIALPIALAVGGLVIELAWFLIGMLLALSDEAKKQKAKPSTLGHNGRK